MNAKIRLAMILGSTREGRFCDVVARWAEREIASHPAFALDVIDPMALDLPNRHKAAAHPATSALQRRIGAADGFVIVTPEYNHGYPAVLKFLVDEVRDEWEAKPVGFVSYGGVSGGLRAVEQLRLVFAELHAVGIRDSVSFANAWDQFDEDGQPRQPAAAHIAMGNMLGRLQWWAGVLRDARFATPYRSAA